MASVDCLLDELMRMCLDNQKSRWLVYFFIELIIMSISTLSKFTFSFDFYSSGYAQRTEEFWSFDEFSIEVQFTISRNLQCIQYFILQGIAHVAFKWLELIISCIGNAEKLSQN